MNITPISWKDIKEEMNKSNPGLAEAIDTLDLKAADDFFLVDYPFGVDILNSGTLMLPSACGDVVPISDLTVSSYIQKNLSYSACPVGILLNNSVEVYYQTSERVIADKLWKAGAVFGVWEIFDKKINKNTTQSSCLSAGARSIFMLPKISDFVSHNRLKKIFGIKAQAPKVLYEHRDFFKELVRKSCAEDTNNWTCKVLFFSKSAVEKILASKNKKAQFYFLNTAWDQSYNCRRQFENNMAWEELLKSLSMKSIHLRSKICSHLKQLLLIKESIFPGMVFALEDSEHVGPIKLIQKIYKEVYRLKEYAPIMMHPAHLVENKKEVYYSLNYPNHFDTYFPHKSYHRLMEELSFIEEVIHLAGKNIGLNQENVQLFHSMANGDPRILAPRHIVKYDDCLKQYFLNHPDESFPGCSSFFKGCVKVS